MVIFRKLRDLATGVISIMTLVVTAVFGLLPDSREAVAEMQRLAVDRGLDDHVRFDALSIGGLGTSPAAIIDGWVATPDDLDSLLVLLRDAQQIAAETKKTPDLGVHARMRVGETRLSIRSVPTENDGALLRDLVTIPHLPQVEYRINNSFDIDVEDGARDSLIAVGDRLNRGPDADNTVSVSFSGYGQPELSVHPGATVTSSLLLEKIDRIRMYQEPLAPLGLEVVTLTGAGPGELKFFPDSFDPELFRPLVELEEPGTYLSVRDGGRYFRAVIGGTHEERAESAEEKALREVVEKR